MNGIRKLVWVWDRMGNELLPSDRFAYTDTAMEDSVIPVFSSAHRPRNSLSREEVFLPLRKGYVVLGMPSSLRKSVRTEHGTQPHVKLRNP